jgi:hypothetical protein
VLALIEAGRSDVVCISALPPYAFAPARAMCKQIRERFPKLKVVVCVWGFSGDTQKAIPYPFRANSTRSPVHQPRGGRGACSGTLTTVDFRLAVAEQTQTVEITENAATVQTENGDIATTIISEQLANLPNPGNDLSFVAQLAPGAVMNTQGGYGNFEVFGLPATSNVFTYNGQYDNDPIPEPQQQRRHQLAARQ